MERVRERLKQTKSSARRHDYYHCRLSAQPLCLLRNNELREPGQEDIRTPKLRIACIFDAAMPVLLAIEVGWQVGDAYQCRWYYLTWHALRYVIYIRLHHTMLFPVPHTSCFSSVSKHGLNDVFIVQYDPLVQPALLRHEIRSSPDSQATIASARFTAARILAGQDDRVLVIVGPCSIHSPAQAIEYASLLKSKMPVWQNLHIIMRVYL